MSAQGAHVLASGHTVKRLHSRQILLPSHMLPVDLAKVSNEECVLLARFARFVINAFDSILEGIANQSLWSTNAMKLDMWGFFVYGIKTGDGCATFKNSGS